MAFDAGALLATLGLNTKGFNAGLTSATAQTGKFDKTIVKSDKTLQGMSSTASGLGKLMLTGLGFFVAIKVVTGFTRAISNSISAAADLEKSMANVATLVDTSVVNIDSLTESVSEMTSEVLKSAEDLSAGLYQVFSAGVTDSAEAMDVLRVSAIAATAGLSTTLTSVDAITTVLNAYGLEAEKATEISDLMFQTVKLGKTTFDQLAQAIGTVISPAATVGIELDELFAALATLTKGGINTMRATTALRATLLAIIKPMDSAKKEAKRLGLEWTVSALKAKGLVRFLAEIREATGGSSEAMAELFPNVRALNGVMALTGKQFEELINIQRQFEDRAGSTQKAFSKQADTFRSKVLRMELAVDRLQVALGRLVLPAITGPIEDLADNLETLLDAFKGLKAFFDIGFKGKDSEFFKNIEINLEKLVKSRQKAAKEIRQVAIGGDLFPKVGEFKLPDVLPEVKSIKQENIKLDEKQIELLDELIMKSKELGKTELEIFDMTVAGSVEKLQAILDNDQELNDKQKEGLMAIFALRQELTDQEKLSEFEAENARIASVEAFEQRKLQIRKSFMKQFENAGLTQLQIVARNEKRTIAQATKLGQDTAQITKFFEEKKTQIKIQEAQKQFAVAGKFGTSISNLSANLNEILVSQGKQKSKELFAITKAANIVTAIANTATAATAALKTPPPPVGIALAGFITAAGLAQVAVISQQKLAEGGLVTSPISALVGEEGPEAVIPIEKGVAPIVEESVKNVIEEEQRRPIVNVLVVDDPREIAAIAARVQAETGEDMVLRVISKRNMRSTAGENTVSGLL